MAESLNQRINAMSIDEKSKRELRGILEAMRQDVAALATKLNADATVTDTNYGATPNLLP